MTTLAANSPRTNELGDMNDIPVIASDIIFEGAAVGIVDASGHARPLATGDGFGGFCVTKADNSGGSAADINVKVRERGRIKLAVSGAVITDVGLPVYASDDDTFVFSPVGGTLIGFIRRWVSAGVVIVEFNAPNFVDPYQEYTVRELISGAKTLNAEDCGKLFWVDTTAIFTLPATAVPALCKIVCGGAFGAVQITLNPAAADSLEGPDITAADDKDVINTLATARRGDFAVIGHADAVGHTITELKGTWAREV